MDLVTWLLAAHSSNLLVEGGHPCDVSQAHGQKQAMATSSAGADCTPARRPHLQQHPVHPAGFLIMRILCLHGCDSDLLLLPMPVPPLVVLLLLLAHAHLFASQEAHTGTTAVATCLFIG
jgi:hypothetical protein